MENIQGRDEKTLNLSLLKASSKAKEETQTNLELTTKTTTKSKFNKNIIYIFLSFTFITALIAGGIITSQNALKNTPAPQLAPITTSVPNPIIPTSTPSATPIPTLSPSPLPELILSDYKLLVLNGTGGKGVAGAVKDILEAEGFEDIKADNADKFDFTLTQVQLKQDVPSNLFDAIDRSLNSDYDVTRSAELLTSSSKYDVIITVGVN